MRIIFELFVTNILFKLIPGSLMCLFIVSVQLSFCDNKSGMSQSNGCVLVFLSQDGEINHFTFCLLRYRIGLHVCQSPNLETNCHLEQYQVSKSILKLYQILFIIIKCSKNTSWRLVKVIGSPSSLSVDFKHQPFMI